MIRIHRSISSLLLVGLISSLLSMSAQAQIYSGSNFGPIPDGAGVGPDNYGAPRDIRFEVRSRADSVSRVRLFFRAQHTWVGDLKVQLIAPDGRVHLLFERTGATGSGSRGFPSDLDPNVQYLFGDDFSTVTGVNWWSAADVGDAPIGIANLFRSVGAGPVASGNLPPVTSFDAVFESADPNGTWILRFEDGWSGDTGEVIDAELVLPATGQEILVRSTADAGTGSLREAMSLAQPGDAIRFASPLFTTPQRIDLLSRLPLLRDGVGLFGPGANLLTVRRAATDDFRIFELASDTVATVSGMTLAGGSESAADGGGVRNAGRLFLIRSVVRDSFGQQGGGIQNAIGGELSLIGSSVIANTAATVGGGIHNLDAAAVRDSTISGNVAGVYGGGVSNVAIDGNDANFTSILLLNSTVANNDAGRHSGLAVTTEGGTSFSIALLQNSLFDNAGDDIATEVIGGSGQLAVLSEGFNLLTDDGAGLFAQATDRVAANADLYPLANAGNGLPMHRPRLSSDAVDSGLAEGMRTGDQRGPGFARVVDLDNALYPNAAGSDGSDIGAYELQSAVGDACDFSNGFVFSQAQAIECYESVPFNHEDLVNLIDIVGGMRERSSLRETYEAQVGWRARLAALDDPSTLADYPNDFRFHDAVMREHKAFANVHFRYSRPACYTEMLTGFIPLEFGATMDPKLGQIVFVEGAPYLAGEYQSFTGIDTSVFTGQRVVSINGVPVLDFFRDFGRTDIRFDENDGINLSEILTRAGYSVRLTGRHDFAPLEAQHDFVFETVDGVHTEVSIPWLFAPKTSFTGADALTSSTAEFVERCTAPGAAGRAAEIAEELSQHKGGRFDAGPDWLEKTRLVRQRAQASRGPAPGGFFEVPPDELGIGVSTVFPNSNGATVLDVDGASTTVIRLDSFTGNWFNEVRQGTQYACANSDRLVIDLRANGGGFGFNVTWLARHLFPDLTTPVQSAIVYSLLNTPANQELSERSARYASDLMEPGFCGYFNAGCLGDLFTQQQWSNDTDRTWMADSLRFETRAGIMEPLTDITYFHEAADFPFFPDVSEFDPIACPGSFVDDRLIIFTNGASYSAAYFFPELIRDRSLIVTAGGYEGEPLVSGGARGGAILSTGFFNFFESFLANRYGPASDPLPLTQREVSSVAEVAGGAYLPNLVDLHADNVPFGEAQFNGWSDSSDTDGYMYRRLLMATGALKAESTVTIVSDEPDPSAVGVSYTVSVGVAGEFQVPTGRVDVSDGAGANCSFTLVQGAGSCQLSSGVEGSLTLMAVYSGDSRYLGGADTEPHQVAPQPLPLLRISLAGSGQGRVTTQPIGIDCGPDCIEPFQPGAQVTLLQDPDPGSIADGFGGDPDCLDGVVTMTGDLQCIGFFRPVPEPRLRVDTVPLRFFGGPRFATTTLTIVNEGDGDLEIAGITLQCGQPPCSGSFLQAFPGLGQSATVPSQGILAIELTADLDAPELAGSNPDEYGLRIESNDPDTPQFDIPMRFNAIFANGFESVARPDGLVHRWSFNGDLVDPVGGADALLPNGAPFSGGSVALFAEQEHYVELPIRGTLAALDSFTIETWMTRYIAVDQSWARIFDFGRGTSNYLFATVQNAENNALRTAINNGSGEQRVEGPAALPDSRAVHFALTLDAANDEITMYVDGAMVARSSWSLTPSQLGDLNGIWIGRSQFAPDPYLDADIDEFRIYDIPLPPEQIQASFNQGPDAP